MTKARRWLVSTLSRKVPSADTSTGEKGTYTIDITDPDAVLIFSFVGYVSQEVTVARRSSIDIVLKVDNKALEEVVVVGYGTQKRSDLTGSVSSVKAEDIKSLPVRSVNEALQGRAAGVQVTRNDGSPGAPSDIVIRGVRFYRRYVAFVYCGWYTDVGGK